MAAKRDFVNERKSSDARPKASLQNQASSTNRKSENVDNMVSSFLAEISDLSSGINRDVDPANTPDPALSANEFKILPHFKLQESARSQEDLDLEVIDNEIEQSLIELESLRLEERPTRDVRPEAIKTAPESGNVAAVVGTSTPKSSDPGEKLKTRSELFRNGSSFSGAAPRRRIGLWIIAVLAVAGILCFLAYYLFRSSWGTAINGSPASISEPEELPQPPEDNAGAITKDELSRASTEQKKNRRPEYPVSAEILTRIQSEFTALARRKTISGTVDLEAPIGEQGNVVASKAISGPNLLRGTAGQALMNWESAHGPGIRESIQRKVIC